MRREPREVMGKLDNVDVVRLPYDRLEESLLFRICL